MGKGGTGDWSITIFCRAKCSGANVHKQKPNYYKLLWPQLFSLYLRQMTQPKINTGQTSLRNALDILYVYLYYITIGEVSHSILIIE